jgi:hypothetical protein
MRAERAGYAIEGLAALAASQPIAYKYRDPLLLQESPSCNCCNNCGDLCDLHLQHFWQKAAYMPGFWHSTAVPQLPKLPQFVQHRVSAMMLSVTDTDNRSDNSLSLAISCSQDSHILILIILIRFLIAQHTAYSTSLKFVIF